MVQTLECEACGNEVKRFSSEIEKHVFCSSSCFALFNNTQRKKNGFTCKGKTKTVACSMCSKQCVVALNAKNTYVCDNCIILPTNKKQCIKCKIAIPTHYKTSTSNKIRISHAEYCASCHKLILKENGIKAGTISAASQQRRSKNEIYFAELCAKQFNNVSNNEPFFEDHKGYYWDADVILYDQKIAVLWNGAWHYKQISSNQSLQQIQARDKLKNKIIKENGFKLYVVKDMGKHNPEFVEEQFSKFLQFVSAT